VTVSKTTTTLEWARKFTKKVVGQTFSSPDDYNVLLAKAADSLTAELQKENDKLAAGLRKWELALQSLTPGGSEYVGDPERCVAHVRRSTESRWEFTKKTKIERDELQKENARLKEIIDGIQAIAKIDDDDCQFYEKENARLREALEKLVDYKYEPYAQSLAVAALSKEKE
jgi:hypothetical protein